ncbi:MULTISPECIES: IS630 transposase-related protein [Synechocystis]|uniref:Helix-turn-helix domain-containing protein n=1 Tax=Synechocystis salina LEGE 00031 TaxID=1828736 RepID=A0ABR9VVF3_9SYNC|nr:MULTISPECIES: IS630 transposase-related protein [Synechocystis]MBD2653069.1 helix-turn-helix domain-containing protein [Synechocystis sp. FACHB-383]MBE9195250.1 helix-turn-helix domain-containing protein [Synechocystis sp. LEGE 06083]MBE9242673.1 helix-turn-helix domain-containing protein [Synechocystis salina LEGE 00041]MBE9255328.1 helix-turn-helix domain-containing protein [Synechocystis salina LEGE 00031]
MSYSLDLRLKVIQFIEEGGGVTKAAKTFKVSKATIYRWLGREDLAPTKVENRRRKIDVKELEEDVEKNPHTPLIERAQKFGVTPATLCYRFKKMKITRRKNGYFIKKERKKNNDNVRDN